MGTTSMHASNNQLARKKLDVFLIKLSTQKNVEQFQVKPYRTSVWKIYGFIK